MTNDRSAGSPPRDGTGAATGSRRWRGWVLLGFAFVVVGVVGGLIGAAVSSSGSSSSGSRAASTAAVGCPVTPVADRVLPSVVTISASGQAGGGTGSGEVIRDNGYILTNNHVIAPAASGGSVHVLFSDGATAAATITGRDPLTDLAVLKVNSMPHLKPIALGSSKSLQVGEPVIAMGAPLGLSGTVTAGIVSALDRTVEVPGENDKSALLVSAVQTDAAINPGNSGGALVNCDSQLVGVPSAGASVPSSSGETSGGNIGLGFAIPVDLAKTVSSEIIATGRVTHADFGLQSTPISPTAASEAGVPEGLFVRAVVPNGPAAQAGIHADDVITKVEGHAATSNVQLQEITLTRKPGDKVSIEYSRAGKPATATITLGRQP
ncbi:MAG: trypsin-like peptidase domain-containing protein [Actinobacteria bacterium]|nr:trypsin-like peptidase domain-containing protein [Actinomycetota bacterium]